MVHVVVAGPLHPSGRALLDAAKGVSVTYIAKTSEPSLAAEVSNADAVLLRTQPMTAQTIARGEKLKIVSRHGVGFDAVDVDALSARGIPLVVCGDVNSTTVAEHTAMMILSVCKRSLRANACIRSGHWEWRNQLESRDVHGQNLLIVGYGRIGRQTAALMKSFGMNVRAHDPFLQKKGWPDNGVEIEGHLPSGLAWADVISFSVPHTGKPLIGEKEISIMRDGVVLINTARGGIIDEAALVKGLESGKVGGAGLDVFTSEPLPPDHPLAKSDQVLLSPHIGGLTLDAAERMAVSSAENILNFFTGNLDSGLIVNREQIYVQPQT